MSENPSSRSQYNPVRLEDIDKKGTNQLPLEPAHKV